MKILHLITGLDTGGAEMMLYKLLSKIDKNEFNNIVVSITDIGPVGEKIRTLRIPVYALKMKSGINGIFCLGYALKILKIINMFKPDAIQTWMYHANLLGLIVGKIRRIPVVWNIRCSDMEVSYLTKFIIKTSSLLSRCPCAVIVNSYAGKDFHKRIGYNPREWVVISNGFDTDKFFPDKKAKLSLCKELDIEPDYTLIGMVARFDPVKDHKGFLKALALVLNEFSDVHAVLVGSLVNGTNKELIDLINGLNINRNVHLLGERADIHHLTAAFDIAASSSYGEGFSNVIGEAMSCGVPCVVTNVGDSARIVQGTGYIVQPGNTRELADAFKRMIKLGKEKREELGIMARRIIIEKYSIEKIVKQFEDLYNSLSS